MSSTNKTTYYELSQYVGTDKPTYLGDYNSDMSKIDTAIHEAATDADTAVSTANAASSAASAASTSASAAVTTANAASQTATEASTTAGTALTNAGAALTAAQNAETKAKANDITNLAPAYDSTLTYGVGDLVTYVDENGTGKLYKCIVAIATPEAFNVNKWDDVTTSEVFREKETNIGTFTTTGNVTTWADLFNEIISTVTFNSAKTYELIQSYADGNKRIFIEQGTSYEIYPLFTRIDDEITETWLWSLFLVPEPTTDNRVRITKLSTSGTTFENRASSIISSQNCTFNLNEI